MRTATIRIERTDTAAMTHARRQFLDAWSTRDYQGEVFSFESPSALFRVLTPKRWELLERLQCDGPLGIRALARALERDVKRVREDAQTLLEVGLIEKDTEGQLVVPFERIHAEFDLGKVA